MNASPELSPRERFLRACRCRVVDRTPGWLMRQAGRYMEEYQAVRRGRSFLELCKSPELCRDVTMQPIDVLGLETAIVFSDILLPCEAMGQSLVFEEKRGPVLGPVVRDRAAVEGLRDFEAARATPWPAETIRLLREPLGPDRALIGFCGAPFTMAAYMVEGGGSRQFENVKRMMWGEPETLELLLERITDNLIGYLRAQIEAGADAVQIFDSWAGTLDQAAYQRFAHQWTAKLIRGVADLGAPVISYVNGCDHLLEIMAGSGADVVAIDWRVDPGEALMRVGGQVAIQGNLDPTALLATPEVAARETRRTLEAFAGAPGYIFNVGSGVLQWTPVACAEAVVRTLRSWGS
ncbi:MAG: uroporphyrinogen decarboxylase [Planctomycetota bacterium]